MAKAKAPLSPLATSCFYFYFRLQVTNDTRLYMFLRYSMNLHTYICTHRMYSNFECFYINKIIPYKLFYIFFYSMLLGYSYIYIQIARHLSIYLNLGEITLYL